MLQCFSCKIYGILASSTGDQIHNPCIGRWSLYTGPSEKSQEQMFNVNIAFLNRNSWFPHPLC